MTKNKQDLQSEVSASLSGNINNEIVYLRSKVADLSSLIETSIIINSTIDLDDLIGLVMEKAQSVMKAEASSVLLINERTNMLECEVALGEVGEQVKTIQLKMGEGIAGWVAEYGKPQIIQDVSADSRFSAKTDESTGFQTKSILAAPLIVRDKTIGVAEVINRIDGKAFTEENLELFSTFCRLVAMTIENARMHKIALEKQRLEQELESARFIQQSFMPEVFPDSENQGFLISAKSIPAASVGGDFFDFIEFDDTFLGISVGDVTGKGVPAALYMARLVSDLRLFTQIHKNPSDLIDALNKVLVDRSRRGMFVTFQYGILNTQTGCFTYSNAGHLPFVRVLSSEKKIELLQGGKTIPLGITSPIYSSQDSVQLNKGDFVVLITDGIVEAKNDRDEAYSFKRVMEVLSEEYDSPESVVDNLMQDVQNFAGNTDQHDDLTILTFKWN